MPQTTELEKPFYLVGRNNRLHINSSYLPEKWRKRMAVDNGTVCGRLPKVSAFRPTEFELIHIPTCVFCTDLLKQAEAAEK